MSKTTGQNIRYLLQKENANPGAWASDLDNLLQCGPARALQLMDGQDPTPREMETLAQKFGFTEDELLGSLLAHHNVDIYTKNMTFLKESLEQGDQKALAGLLGVGKVAVSRWFSSKQEPERSRLELLLNFFDLPAGTDLKTEPVFLSRTPVGSKQRRKWLEEHVRKLSPETLRELYPALERLFRDA